MSDISITASAVQKTSSTVVKSGIAGATITAGQSIYEDATTGTIKLANGNSTAATAECTGVSLHAALSGQPLAYANGGALTLNSVLTAGKAYIVSGTAAGGICPIADLTTGWRTSLIGIAGNATTLNIQRINSGVVNA